MRRTWTIIGVADVARSFAWYQTLLGLPKSAPAHYEYGAYMVVGCARIVCDAESQQGQKRLRLERLQYLT